MTPRATPRAISGCTILRASAASVFLPAASAGPALPVVDLKGLRKIAQLAVGRGEIAQGRTARRDRFVEHRLDRRHQPAQALERDRSAGAARIDAGPMQRLADVNVAQS